MTSTTAFVPATLPEEFITSTGTLTPFPAGTLTITSNEPVTSTQIIETLLTQTFASSPGLDLGAISDATGGGTVVSPTIFAEVNTIATTPGNTILTRLRFTPPALVDGQSTEDSLLVVTATSLTPGGAIDSNVASITIPIDVVTAPAITGTVANQPSGGGPIDPFSTVKITDPDFKATATDTATITITDASGTKTDADGILTGSGLSKTGVGTYSIPNAVTPTGLATELEALTFTATAAAAGQTVSFELDATDAKANLTEKNTTTSVMYVNPPQPPTIAGIVTTKTASGPVNPFATVTVTDPNATAKDSATISLVNAGGTTTDANGTLTGTGLTETATAGTYTIAATDPATLTKDLDSVVFTPTTNPAAVTTTFNLTVNDVSDGQAATNNTTTVTESAGGNSGSPPPNGVAPLGPPNNFLVNDQSTSKTFQSQGEPYVGTVAGLTNDIIIVTSDNINVTAEIPNVFIKSGAGMDAINVSPVNGNNVLDGSTNSNFLQGGAGDDTFFVDDRNAPSAIWSTVANFHAGDDLTIWGVTASDFTITKADNMGATGFTGLTWDFAAAGKPDAKATLAGFTQADLTNGKLAVSFGSVDGNNYMLVQGT